MNTSLHLLSFSISFSAPDAFLLFKNKSNLPFLLLVCALVALNLKKLTDDSYLSDTGLLILKSAFPFISILSSLLNVCR